MLLQTFAAFTALVGSTFVKAQYGGFAASCSDISVWPAKLVGQTQPPYTWYLQATCSGSSGEITNYLRLGECIGNSGGRLVAQPK